MVNEGATEVTSSQMIPTELSAGETLKLDLGGTGRAVTGRLLPPADHKEAVRWNQAMVSLQADLLAPPAASTEADRAVFETLRASRPHISATVDRDGTFRIDDVPAGGYMLSVHFFERPAPGHIGGFRFSVSEEEDDKSGVPFDLGSLRLQEK